MKKMNEKQHSNPCRCEKNAASFSCRFNSFDMFSCVDAVMASIFISIACAKASALLVVGIIAPLFAAFICEYCHTQKQKVVL
ncbi:MAG: hypothetical protein HFE62_06320 [Firmicutes bacterium]|nr:hypothetical protein [Bacillota bacterium]